MSVPPEHERVPIHTSSTGKQLGDAIQKEAGKTESEASKHINNINDDKDKKNLVKIIGAGVALVVVVVGGYRWQQHRKSEREKAAEEADNLLDKAGRKVKQGANWFGNKADDVGSKAGEITEEHIQPAVSAATDQVVSAAGSVKETVSDATQGIRAKASTAGLKAEKEGLKASEKSDNIVRSGYDKAANTADKAKDKLKEVGKEGKHEGGNVFSGIGHWFGDRKDDVGDAANAVKGKTKEVLNK